MRGFFGDPTRLFIKPEKPDFFLRTPGIFTSLDSSENRLEAGALSILGTAVFSLRSGCSDDAVEKLVVWGREGGPMALASEGARDSGIGGGGAGRGGGSCLDSWGGCWWCTGDCTGDFVASIRLRIAVPSNGAPMSSSDVLVLRGRTAFVGGDSGPWSVRLALARAGAGGCGCCCWL